MARVESRRQSAVWQRALAGKSELFIVTYRLAQERRPKLSICLLEARCSSAGGPGEGQSVSMLVAIALRANYHRQILTPTEGQI